MQQMALWENDRERMTQDMEQQKARLRSMKSGQSGRYSSNISSSRMVIE